MANQQLVFLASIELIKKKNGRVLKQRYDEEAFGSWYVEFQYSRTLYRLIWDGKQDWLILQNAKTHEQLSSGWVDIEVDNLQLFSNAIDSFFVDKVNRLLETLS